MEIFGELPDQPLPRESALTIGVFDGVHCGHQSLIGRAVARARQAGRVCGVLTFDPHPVEVLAPQADIRYLTTIQERVRLIEGLGADFVYVVHFTREVSQQSARDFVRPLVDRLSMRDLVIGYDFTLGHKRQGDAAFLRALGAEWGFALEVVPPAVVAGQVVSSTRIRQALGAGRIDDALVLLGRSPYRLAGNWVGDSTVQIEPKRQLPADGRYRVSLEMGSRPALTCGAAVSGSQVVLDCDTSLDAAPGEGVRLSFGPGSRVDSETEGYQELEHTADVALRVHALTLAELFRHAALGMFALMTDVDRVQTTEEYAVRLSAPDRETLLVNWLNELLFQYETRQLVCCDFDVAFGAGGQLRAVARGGHPAAEIRKHIKAATFHDLRIVESDGHWVTTVVFDI